MRNYKFLLIILIAQSCNTKDFKYGNENLLSKIEHTPISSIKNNPTLFDNDTIRLTGYLHLSLENWGLINGSNQIWINSLKPAAQTDSVWINMNGKDVEIIGIFKAGKTGHLGLYDGKFEKIYFIRTK